jgi:hypothetical protein
VTDLDARYGRKPTNNKRNIIVLASILLITFFSWSIAVNFFTPAEKTDPTAKAVEFTELGENRIGAEIKMIGWGVKGVIRCSGKALDDGYGVVGYREFDTLFEGEQEKRFVLTINTTAAASSIVVEKCKLQ